MEYLLFLVSLLTTHLFTSCQSPKDSKPTSNTVQVSEEKAKQVSVKQPVQQGAASSVKPKAQVVANGSYVSPTSGSVFTPNSAVNNQGSQNQNRNNSPTTSSNAPSTNYYPQTNGVNVSPNYYPTNNTPYYPQNNGYYPPNQNYYNPNQVCNTPPPACLPCNVDSCYEPYDCCSLLQTCFAPMLASLQYRGGDGISYKNGYATAEFALGLYNPDWRGYPFVDVRLHRLDNGRFASNVGLGWRAFSCDFSNALGINVYYDYRRLHHGNLNQIGVGFEYLGPCLDVRGNGYIPFGNKNVPTGDITIYEFPDNLYAIRERNRHAMWGMDLEIGKTIICCNCWDVYLAAGPYFYSSACCNSTVGGMGRLNVNLWTYLSVGVYATYDRYFGGKVQGEVALNLPLPRVLNTCYNLFRPVRRNDIIVVENVNYWDSNF